jgi:hypothetical protein
MNAASRDPVFIFSKPSAMAQSARPAPIARAVSHRAVEPVEQLLLTLVIGIPVSPSSYMARWPEVESPYT